MDVASNPETRLLSGPGSLSQLIADHDWASTPIGPREGWPVELKTVVGLILRSPLPIVTLWGEAGVMIYNDAYSMFAGGRHPRLLGSNVREGWPEVADFNDNVVKTVFRRGETLSYKDTELTLHRHGRPEQVWLDLDYSPVVSEAGERLGVIAMVVETTQKVMAERHNAAERQRLEQLFHLSPSFMALLAEPEHRFMFANSAYLELIGRSGDVVGRAVRDVLPELAGQGFFELLDQVFTTGEPFIGRQVPVRLRREGRDGAEYGYVDFVYQPIRDEAGNVSGIFVSGYDVTELRQAQDRLRLAYDAGNIGAFEVVPASRTITVSPEFCRIFGLPEQAVLPLDVPVATVHPDDRPRVVNRDATVRTDAMGYIEYRIIRPDTGTLRWIARRGEASYDEDGSILRYSGVVYDITDRKTAEEQLRRLADTLEQRVAERTADLEAAHEALRQAQKMEAVGQLTGGIAHDFNNLLTGVIGSLDLMQRKLAAGRVGEIDRHVTAAITSANRAAALTHRLLAFSRRQPLAPKPVNANRLVISIEELLRRTIGESIRLEIVTAGGLWQTLCDPHQLESAVLNLAINARDAMPDGGRLTIETCNAHLDSAYAARSRQVRPGQYVCICVSDTGTGMTKDVIDKAFEPFFTTKPLGQGTGLGLSMIYGFARQSDGYAKLYSEVGQGTTVKLYLPRYYGEAEAESEQADAGAAIEAAHPGCTVLVVEDETAVRDLVVEVLGDLGLRTIEALDGPSGLKILQSSEKIDLLVTDVGLPGLNGRQLADGARAVRPDLKILFMTGYAENAAINGGFLEPGMELLTKPFAVDSLAAKVRDMLPR